MLEIVDEEVRADPNPWTRLRELKAKNPEAAISAALTVELLAASEARLAKLEERVEGIAETHRLWDGT